MQINLLAIDPDHAIAVAHRQEIEKQNPTRQGDDSRSASCTYFATRADERVALVSGGIREPRLRLMRQRMQMMYRCFLAAALLTAPTLAAAHNELAREPRGIDTLVPASTPSQPDSSAQKITIYTAKTIVTLDPGTPAAEAVAVMNGKILGVGTLDEVRGWITNQEFEIDRRFQDAVIVPGFIEAHMHPQFTGVLWQGVYVGRFDRAAPDGTPIKGLEPISKLLGGVDRL
jgi:hypothetical protein